MVKLVALVFYENDFFNLHDTLTAVNLFLQKLIEVRSYWFVSLYLIGEISCCTLQHRDPFTWHSQLRLQKKQWNEIGAIHSLERNEKALTWSAGL